MTKRPSFQFYPADWRSNANLRRCSPAARGVWMDILCVLHDSDSYGIVRWPLVELARAAGAALTLVRELVAKAVLKGCDDGECEPYVHTPRSGRRDGEPVTLIPSQDGPLWYSSRMVKDEYVRLLRTEGGKDTRFGASPKPSPKPGLGDGPSSSSAASSSPAGDSKEDRSLRERRAREGENVSQSPPRRRKAPQTELPEGFPGELARAQAAKFWSAHGRQDLVPQLANDVAQFRDHHLKIGSTMANWEAAWRFWYRKTLKEPHRGERPNGQRKSTSTDQHLAGIAMLVEDIRGRRSAGQG